MTLLSVTNISKDFVSANQSTLAIKEISFEVREREFVSVIGPSGCGKTTLLMIISGLMPPSSGEIALKGVRVNSPPPGLILLFQDYSRSLMPWRKVLANVCYGLELKRQRLHHKHKELKKQAEKYLEAVGLLRFRNHYPWQLSGGMQQRVAIARALACEPSLLLMDEPFGSLDAQTRKIMQQELTRLWLEIGKEETKKTVVFVTHSVIEAVYLADRIFVLTNRPGKVKGIVDVNLPRPRNYDSEEYLGIRSQVLQLLEEEVQKSIGQNTRYK